ncbi:MAG TPA: pilus assembly PilX N-terminal domain-containing protein [bacterium]|nr:pilus assembly PilX N-terminal domain-containing protein [bacterium]
MKRIEYKAQKGSVILMAIFLVFFISVLMITVELMRLSDLEIVSNQIEDMQAYYCAEAGIEQMLWLIRSSSNLVGGWPSKMGSQNLTVQSECNPDAISDYDTDWNYIVNVSNGKMDPDYLYYNAVYIVSTGYTNRFKRAVRAELRRTIYSATPRYIQILRWCEVDTGLLYCSPAP